MYISRFYYFLLSVYIWHVKLIIYVISVCTCVYPTLQPNSSDGFTVKAKAKGHNWETIGRLHLGGNWETSGRHVGNYWGPHLADNWALRTAGTSGRQLGENRGHHIWNKLGDNLETIGKPHLQDIRETTAWEVGEKIWKTTQVAYWKTNSGDSSELWKTIRRPHLGNNWETTGAHGFRRRPCREFQETVLFIEKMFRDWERISGRQLGYHILETKWETSGKHLGDNVENKNGRQNGRHSARQVWEWKHSGSTDSRRQGGRQVGDKVEDKVGDTVGDKANTVGDIVGDKLGHKLGDTVGRQSSKLLGTLRIHGEGGRSPVAKGWKTKCETS